MAWSTPRTWVNDDLVTATMMNAHVRDQFDALADWTTYEPTWSASNGTPDIGNGTITGQYRRWGNVCHVRFDLAFGSTTDTDDADDWRFTLPFNMGSPTSPLTAIVIDSGTGAHTGATWQFSAHQFRVFTRAGSAAIGHGNPMTWATGDRVVVNGLYRVQV